MPDLNTQPLAPSRPGPIRALDFTSFTVLATTWSAQNLGPVDHGNIVGHHDEQWIGVREHLQETLFFYTQIFSDFPVSVNFPL